MKRFLLTVALFVSISPAACAGELDLGLRFGRVVDTDAGGYELALRYFPVKMLSFTGTVGYSQLRYDKGWYNKDVNVIPLAGYANVHLPLPLISPYGGVGGVLYTAKDISSPNLNDRGTERSGTFTVQGGVDISLPLPKSSLTIEVRRMINDKQTMVVGGYWFRF